MYTRRNFYMVLVIILALSFLVQAIEGGNQKRIEAINVSAEQIYPVGDWRGFGLSSLFIYKLLVLFTLFFMVGCATPEVEVGQVTIVIKEPIKTANKGEM